jgi:hypothetical protein
MPNTFLAGPAPSTFVCNDRVHPGSHENGLDIRFNMPTMFDETTGRFSITPGERDIEVAAVLTATVAGGTAANWQNFGIEIDLWALDDFVAGVPQLNAARLQPIIVTPPDGAGVAQLRDAAIITVGGRHMARIQVGNLAPSTLYTSVSVAIGAGDPVGTLGIGRFFRMNRMTGSVATVTRPMYTLLEFDVRDLGIGPREIIIQPFGIPGYYQVLEFMGGVHATPDFPGTWVWHDGVSPMPPLPIPAGLAVGGAPGRYQVAFSTVNPNIEGAFELVITSQIIVYNPIVRPPVVGLPDNFVVPDEDVHLRPHAPEPWINPCNAASLTEGQLDFRARWSMINEEELRRMFDAAGTDTIQIEYMLMLSDVPEIDFDLYSPFAVITIEVTSGAALSPSSRPAFRVDYVDIAWNDSQLAHRDPPHLPPGTGDWGLGEGNPMIEILNSGPHFFYQSETLAGRVTNRFFIDLFLRTEAVSRDLPFAFDWRFNFPGVYFMYVEAINWPGRPDAVGDNLIRIFRSTEDSLTLDVLTRPNPPTPTHLEVQAIHDEVEPLREAQFDVPASFNVSYRIPLADIRQYLRRMHNFYPIITANLYIGAFEDTILDTFMPILPNGNPGRQPSPAERADLVMSIEYDPDWMGAIDLSAPAIQSHLRGGAPTGVVRIANIPLLRHDGSHIGPSPLDIPFCVSFCEPGCNTATCCSPFYLEFLYLAEIDALLRNTFLTYHPIDLTLYGLDENLQLYMFVDLVIAPFTPDPVRINPPTTSRYDILWWGCQAGSPLSGVTGETTPGIIVRPEPPEIYPPAPENVGVKDVGQTTATLYWDPVESIPGAIIEYEIIRIDNGPRMTDEELSSQDHRFVEFFNSLPAIGTSGWRTDRTDITLDGELLMISGNSLVPATVDHYIFTDDLPLTLQDNTLLPNNAYFYYIRTRRIIEYRDANGVVIDRFVAVSQWVEVVVTTPVVDGPYPLRLEDGNLRPGFNGQTQVFVSWDMREGTLPPIDRVTEWMGREFIFEYQVREEGGDWTTPARFTVGQLSNRNNIRVNPDGSLTFFYMHDGLRPGTLHQMRVRLLDIEAGDASLWSNIIIFLTEFEDLGDYRNVHDWLNYLRRRLEELLQRPFWFSERTPNSMTAVYRPAEIFAGLMASTPGTAIFLENTNVDNITYYFPMSVILDAHNARRGFMTRYSDTDILFAPGFLNHNHNQALMDMLRMVDARGDDVTDTFVRVNINRRPVVGELHGSPAVTPLTEVRLEMVPTNSNIRNIRTWDVNVTNAAFRMVDARVTDPVLFQNIYNMITLAEMSPEEIQTYIYQIVASFENDLIRMVGNDMRTNVGILGPQTIPVTEFDASMMMVATNTDNNMTVGGFRHDFGQWISVPVTEHYNGNAITVRTPGIYAFSGRTVNIPGIVNVPQGGTITSLVARYGLEDLFGLRGVDLEQNATRYMVAGSIARMAGAPRTADSMNWINANLSVQMSSRTAHAFIPRQEAIAIVMSLYELRTNTRVDTIMIRNFYQTARMNLDSRYAHAVRAAFEVGLVSDSYMQPGGPITIGEFLNMLALLDAIVPI